MGGQTADTGAVESEEAKASVQDVQQQGQVQVIVAELVAGQIEAGTRVKATLSSGYRHEVAANHTATHLLHYALRARLGKDVTQAGSAVRADKFRFDFAYHAPLGTKRLAEIEELVNRRIVENHPVRTFTTSLEHAKDLAATSELGVFKIVSEGSVGANVRRIEGITGRAAVAYYRQRDSLVSQAAAVLGSTEEELLHGLTKLQAHAASLEAEVRGFVSESARDVVKTLATTAAQQDGVNVVAQVIEARDMEHLLSLVDQVRDRIQPAVVVLAADLQGKGALVVSASSGLAGINAGQIVKLSAQRFAGGGGGTPQLGRGGADPARLSEAVAAAREAVVAGLGA
jgi:alanyl-tRNA synthetase